MRKALIVSVALSLAAVASAGTPPAEKRPLSFPLPEIKKDCSTCHVLQGGKPTPALAKKLPDLCLDCHPDRVAPQEHPVDVAPSSQPKNLPLADGKMTCVTCHNPHQNPYGSLLRLPETELCFACHPY